MGSFIMDTRRAMLGPRHELTCLRGSNEDESERRVYWLRPQKLPQGIMDQIGALQVTVLAEKGAIRKIKVLTQAKTEGRDLTDEETEDAVKLMRSLPEDTNDQITRLAIMHGIGEHNFTEDGTVSTEPLPKDAVEEVLRFGPLAQEVTAVIMEHSRPLPKPSTTN